MLRLADGAICGVAAGVATGVAARVAMRMVADGVPDGVRTFPAFTVEGTAGIVVAAVLAGAPLGVVYAATHRALPGPAAARGLLFGAILLLLIGPLFFVGTPSEFGEPGTHLGRVALFALLFPIFGAAAGTALAPSTRVARMLPAALRSAVVVLALAGGALLAAGTFGLGVESARLYGAASAWLAVPWVIAALVLATVIRPRLASVARLIPR